MIVPIKNTNCLLIQRPEYSKRPNAWNVLVVQVKHLNILIVEGKLVKNHHTFPGAAGWSEKENYYVETNMMWKIPCGRNRVEFYLTFGDAKFMFKHQKLNYMGNYIDVT